MSTALAEPDLYAEVYAQQLPFIRSIIRSNIRRSGCPSRHLEDVTSEVVLAIINSDGLARYDSRIGSLRAYLALYVSQVARTIIRRILAQEGPTIELEGDWEAPAVQSPEDFEAFLAKLLESTTDDDARAFITVATMCATYAKARAELVALGWESNRIRRAVRRGRAAVRACL